MFVNSVGAGLAEQLIANFPKQANQACVVS